MDKELELILSKGYFPTNELPKSFSTESFAIFFGKYRKKISPVQKASKCIRLSCPKVGLSRKVLKIPNPIHYAELAEYILENWSFLEPIFSESTISSSLPNLTAKGISQPLYSFKSFSRDCIRDSFKHLFELNTDISKFYPSIYTHSIGWAIDGKENSKDPIIRKTLIGNKIDHKVRLLQDGQSVGIPIGPYCSQIISELINCKIDSVLLENTNELIGHRFIDDRKLYFNNYDDAEKCYNLLLSQLAYYELEPNTSKTSIKKLPVPLVSSWKIEVQNFNFRIPDLEPSQTYPARKRLIQETDLINFFSIVFESASKYPDEYVFKYSMKVIKNIKIEPDNIDLFESLIYKILLTEPSTFPDLVDILVKYNEIIDYDKLSSVIHQLLIMHENKGHDFEVIWTLYLARLFNLHIDFDYISWIGKESNALIKHVLYDLSANSLIVGEYNVSVLSKGFTTNDLIDEDWLFAYFAYYNDLPNCDFTKINQFEFRLFKELKNNKIEFYKHLTLEEMTKPEESSEIDLSLNGDITGKEDSSERLESSIY